MIEKKLTIREIFNEMKVLKARLIRLAEKYNRATTDITAVNYKNIMTSGGRQGDIMLNKVIKKEELENEFDIVKTSYNSYKELAIEEIKNMIANNSVEYCIVYFRDSLKWNWRDISKLFNYSIRQCQRLYKKKKYTD